MNAETARRLIALNRLFYQTFGREFASTRQRLQPGVMQVLGTLNGDESILDLGCGNGELARELTRRGHRGSYTGIDFSLTLLEVARHGWEDAPATFLRADLSAAGWERKIAASGAPPFDLVTAFATLHHIPGTGLRQDILRKVHAFLPPGGRFIHSEWQFLNSEKLSGRIQPWAEVGLKETDVEPNDYLLDWRQGGRGLRYAHHFSEPELEALAGSCGFRVRQTSYSDGENGRLSLYQAWERT